MNFTAKSDDVGKLLLRVAVGGLMLFHGVSKLSTGVAWIEGMLGGFGFMAYATYLAEVLAPILILVGVWTRPAALLIMIDMLTAILLVFGSAALTIKEMGGGWTIELEVFFLLSALALWFTGAGKYSIKKGIGVWD
ncbi:MAG TPA: DoxX family protein [Bacteroidota bacterium]|nr:DoxX family protein [Bacteroidota bacterium]